MNTNFQKSKSEKGDDSKKNKKKTFFNFSSVHFTIILFQLTKFEAPSCHTFRDIMITNFQSPNLHREKFEKNRIFFFKIFTN